MHIQVLLLPCLCTLLGKVLLYLPPQCKTGLLSSFLSFGKAVIRIEQVSNVLPAVLTKLCFCKSLY